MPLTRADIEQHSSRKSCWVAIHGAVYDVTGTSPQFILHSFNLRSHTL